MREYDYARIRVRVRDKYIVIFLPRNKEEMEELIKIYGNRIVKKEKNNKYKEKR